MFEESELKQWYDDYREKLEVEYNTTEISKWLNSNLPNTRSANDNMKQKFNSWRRKISPLGLLVNVAYLRFAQHIIKKFIAKVNIKGKLLGC